MRRLVHAAAAAWWRFVVAPIAALVDAAIGED
jgi:hypothetical protein